MWTPEDECFKMLFTGHPDVYGAENGACVKRPPTQEIFESHLHGPTPIGIYCMMPGNIVQWACTDIDIDDYPMASNLASALRHMGFNPFIETSRSKGYHVWVFFKEEVPARAARHMMLVAHQAANVPIREINPKQYELTEKKPYGNYVRLPYPHVLEGSPQRKVQRAPFKPMLYSDFVWTAYDSGASRTQAEGWARHWVEPVAAIPIVAKPVGTTAGMSPLTKHVYRNGPGEGWDRSTTLVRLVRLMHEDGIPASDAKGFLIEADARWGKFSGRADCDERLEETLRTSYV